MKSRGLTPWAIREVSLEPMPEVFVWIVDAAGQRIGRHDREIAALIVQAVNQHAALTAVAEAARDFVNFKADNAAQLIAALAALEQASSVTLPAPKASE